MIIIKLDDTTVEAWYTDDGKTEIVGAVMNLEGEQQYLIVPIGRGLDGMTPEVATDYGMILSALAAAASVYMDTGNAYRALHTMQLMVSSYELSKMMGPSPEKKTTKKKGPPAPFGNIGGEPFTP